MGTYWTKYGGRITCKWCHRNSTERGGCVSCKSIPASAELETLLAAPPEPIFTAKRDSPEDMAALGRILDAATSGPPEQAAERAEGQAAVESVIQVLREGRHRGTD